MDGAGSIPGNDEGDHEDDEGEDFIRLESVNCLGCGAVLSDRENFIEDLDPGSNHRFHPVLCRTVWNVDYGKVEYRLRVAIDVLATADRSLVYCQSCQCFVGVQILGFNPSVLSLLNPELGALIGQYVMLYVANGVPVL